MNFFPCKLHIHKDLERIQKSVTGYFWSLWICNFINISKVSFTFQKKKIEESVEKARVRVTDPVDEISDAQVRANETGEPQNVYSAEIGKYIKLVPLNVKMVVSNYWNYLKSIFFIPIKHFPQITTTKTISNVSQFF